MAGNSPATWSRQARPPISSTLPLKARKERRRRAFSRGTRRVPIPSSVSFRCSQRHNRVARRAGVSGPLNLEAPEVGLACQVKWQRRHGGGAGAVRAGRLQRLLDPPSRRPEDQPQEELGPRVEGCGAEFFDIERPDTRWPHRDAAPGVRPAHADGEEHAYGVDSPLLGYSYYGEVRPQAGLSQRLANQKGCSGSTFGGCGRNPMAARGPPGERARRDRRDAIHPAGCGDVPTGRATRRSCASTTPNPKEVVRTAAAGFLFLAEPYTPSSSSSSVRNSLRPPGRTWRRRRPGTSRVTSVDLIGRRTSSGSQRLKSELPQILKRFRNRPSDSVR